MLDNNITVRQPYMDGDNLSGKLLSPSITNTLCVWWFERDEGFPVLVILNLRRQRLAPCEA
jgi:hypothetical protein